jgi:hypothetical protein
MTCENMLTASALTSDLAPSVHSSCKDAKITINGVTGPTKETGIILKSFLLLISSYIHGCIIQDKLRMCNWKDITINELLVVSNFLRSSVSQRNPLPNHITVVTCSYICLFLLGPVHYSGLNSLQNSCNGQLPKTHTRMCRSCVK